MHSSVNAVYTFNKKQTGYLIITTEWMIKTYRNFSAIRLQTGTRFFFLSLRLHIHSRLHFNEGNTVGKTNRIKNTEKLQTLQTNTHAKKK